MSNETKSGFITTVVFSSLADFAFVNCDAFTAISFAITEATYQYIPEENTSYVTFKILINNKTDNAGCAQLEMRHTVNEIGHKKSPEERQFMLNNGGCAILANTTKFNNVTFTVEPNKNEYLFHTGGDPDKTFTLHVDENEISIKTTLEEG